MITDDFNETKMENNKKSDNRNLIDSRRREFCKRIKRIVRPTLFLSKTMQPLPK